VVQPVVFAIQVALTAVWKSWGIVPDAVVGHSMGEVAAACVAGALTIDDAARLIFERSRLLARLRGQGAMAVVELGLDDARACLAGYTDRLAVAASNGPTSSVLSGDPAALQEVLAALSERGVFNRRIDVDVAAHSPYVAPLRAELRDVLRDLQPQAANVAMYSTVSGDRIDGKALTPAYWARNLGEPVLFSTATLRLLEAGYQTFIEIGPHPTLLSGIEQSAQRAGKQVSTVASLKRGEDEQIVLRAALGNLYIQGYSIDWQRLYPSPGRQVLRLPRYPWQHRRFWLDGSTITDGSEESVSAGPASSGRASAGAALLDRAQLLALGPGVRRAALTEYLRERIAESLGLSSPELDVDQPLTALGLNSLMMFELQSQLKAAYGGGISTDEFAAGITVAQVVSRILQQLETAPERSQAPQAYPATLDGHTTNGHTTSVGALPASLQSADWLSCPDPRPDARLRLFCLPYAGGGASIYREWSKALPPDIEVCAIQLPGREQRFREAPFRQLTALVQTLAKVLEPHPDRPFAIFGHSMGGLIGFELARQCRRQKLPEPVHLFVSASRAPHLLDDEPPLHRLPEPRLVAKLRALSGTPEEMLADPEIMAFYLPLLRADFAVVETYVYRAEEPLGCPISAFGGELDEKIGTEALDAWRTQTRAAFTRQLFPGNHFFLHSAREALLASIAQQLCSPPVRVTPDSRTRGDQPSRGG
jgi:surfactin synthase thioesterase subunit/malonyl CoA-acyl carrier protein transacylase/aryl carrier-like protein